MMNRILQALFRYYPQGWYKLLLALLLALFALAIARVPLLQDLENRSLDYRFSHFQGKVYPDSSILLVSIDNGSLDYFAKMGLTWPWPRSFYAAVTRFLDRAGADLIIYDMLFTHADADRSETDAAETDGTFAVAMQRAGMVILGAELNPDSLQFSTPGSGNLTRFDAQGWGESLEPGEASLPIPLLRETAAGIGLTNIQPDRDGIVRRITPIRHVGDDLVPCLALSGLANLEQQRGLSTGGGRVRIGEREIPIGPDGDYLVNWYGAAGSEGVFRYLPFSSVLKSATDLELGRDPQLPVWLFNHKVIIIGADAAGLRDLRPTPIMAEGFHPGMEIWATVLSNWLQDWHILNLPRVLVLLLSILAALGILIGFERFSGWGAYLLLMGVLLLIPLLALVAWSGANRLFLPIVPALLTVGLAYLIVFANGLQERHFLRDAFGAYVPSDLMDMMIRDRRQPALGGELIQGTAFFSDIQGFTGLSEQMNPPDLVQFLNEYLTEMTDILLAHGGTLDKYEGDAILAFFGAPYPLEDHAKRAVAAAVAMQNRLQVLREHWSGTGVGLPASASQLRMRIGINSGPMLVGNMGSRGRMNYTMMGDTVNVAARLESSAKYFGILIQISESTAEHLGPDFASRALGAVKLVGKTQAVHTFEIMGRSADLGEDQRELLTTWSAAWDACQAGDWVQAHRFLQACVELEEEYPNRPATPARVYLERHLPLWRGAAGTERAFPMIELAGK